MTTESANNLVATNLQSQAVRPVAVIDIGTTAIRLAIAEIGDHGMVRILETVSQGVNLGRDTFTKGTIEKSTIEECVRVLKSYRQLLNEYQIVQPEQVHLVATSAVREAVNQLAFLDRIYIATGFQVNPLDEAEVNRITYLGIQPLLKVEPELAASKSLIIEVGGGSTELLLVQNGQVIYSHSFRLGSLRLRETLEAYRAPKLKLRDIMESQIKRTIDHILQHVPHDESTGMIALGGDVRFAASQLLPDWSRNDLRRLSVSSLEELTAKMLEYDPDELVQQHHLTFPDAESLGPALLIYVMLARWLKLKHILVTNINLRDGLLNEMANRGVGTEEFNQQITLSTIDLGRKFGFEEAHARHVAELSKTLFHALAKDHRLEPRFEQILCNAALLHEIGLFVSTRSYHKHTSYLITNSELFGMAEKDLLLVALVARYHRRASPKPTHQGYATLNRDDRIAVAKMAAMLRVADALDDSHSQRIQQIRCTHKPGRLEISVQDVEDLSLEHLSLKEKGPLFEEIFGMQVLLRQVQSLPD